MKSNQKIIERRADIIPVGLRLIHFCPGLTTFMTMVILKSLIENHKSIITEEETKFSFVFQC